MTAAAPWWAAAVGYEVYLPSFQDSDGDGWGDLPGLTSRLDYLQDLGVDLSWVSPFYPSPIKDHRYDVTDYLSVDSRFGTLEDVDRLLGQARHPGDRRPCGQSHDRPAPVVRERPREPLARLLRLADPRPDTGPPNNWVLHFGGSAWTHDKQTGQYYLHLITPYQPDLNWENPAVAEVDAIIGFWPERGLDGFRVDTAHYLLALSVLLAALPGPMFPCQGEELGLADRQVPPEHDPDPLASAGGPSRGGCRTPMPWEPAPALGFTSAARAWLPFGERAGHETAAVQAAAAASPLSAARRLIAARRALGITPDKPVDWLETGLLVAYRRGHVLAAANLGDAPAALDPGPGTGASCSTRIRRLRGKGASHSGRSKPFWPSSGRFHRRVRHMPKQIIPFRIEPPAAELEDLRTRLRRTRWPEEETVGDWSQGVPLGFLQELCRYWTEDYNWPERERRLNALPQFRTEIDGLGIHFTHMRSPQPTALPLVLTHGWPGSVAEFAKVIGPLTDPVRHGGEPGDAFHVICPSLPGYGFSDKPAEPGWGIERIASAWISLMERLGYPRFAAQGSDWGTSVSTRIAQQAPEKVAGLHLMPPLAPPDPATFGDLTDRERSALESLRRSAETDSGYSAEHATRPQTIGYALTDSPAALSAWIIEKFWSWTDHDGDLETVLSRDELLDNLMLYWLPRAGASSARLYWESIGQVNEWISGTVTDTVSVPVGCSIFPKELQRPSRRWAERRFTDIRYWNEPERGGHFAAFEQPDLFVREVRACFRALR